MSFTVIFSLDPSRVDEVVTFYENAVVKAGLNTDNYSTQESDSASVFANSDAACASVDIWNYGDYREAAINWVPT